MNQLGNYARQFERKIASLFDKKQKSSELYIDKPLDLKKDY